MPTIAEVYGEISDRVTQSRVACEREFPGMEIGELYHSCQIYEWPDGPPESAVDDVWNRVVRVLHNTGVHLGLCLVPWSVEIRWSVHYQGHEVLSTGVVVPYTPPQYERNPYVFIISNALPKHTEEEL